MQVLWHDGGWAKATCYSASYFPPRSLERSLPDEVLGLILFILLVIIHYLFTLCHLACLDASWVRLTCIALNPTKLRYYPNSPRERKLQLKGHRYVPTINEKDNRNHLYHRPCSIWIIMAKATPWRVKTVPRTLLLFYYSSREASWPLTLAVFGLPLFV